MTLLPGRIVDKDFSKVKRIPMQLWPKTVEEKLDEAFYEAGPVEDVRGDRERPVIPERQSEQSVRRLHSDPGADGGGET